MKTSDYAHIVFDALNTRDFTELEKVVSDEIIFEFPGVDRIEGKKRMVSFMKILLRKYPVLKFDVYKTFHQENDACAIWTNKGENNKGENYNNRGVTIFNIQDGMITYISDYFKDTSFTNL